MSAKTGKSVGATGIRPFAIDVPEADLADLRERVAATRWPEKETVDDQSQGVQLETIKELANHWATDYDWRRVEARLNDVPQFMTEIDGLDIHFMHARSKHEDALPIIITHGWPGSPIEQMKIVDRLTNPTAHGATASDAFHVVIPSMPGYGFSGKPTTTGWGPDHIAQAWIQLMKRLGYERFVAQGGDWGAVVTDLMGVQAPPELLGIHSNMPGVVPPAIDQALQTGGDLPADLSADEKRACEQLAFVYQHAGYGLLMGTRPQTLTALADSPAGLAAFLLDHDKRSYEQISYAIVEDKPAGDLTRDDVLDNITLFWLTNTGVSAARLYWEYKGSYFDTKNVTVPTAVSVFPDELFQAPRSWTEQAYPNLIHFNTLDQGNHFAAWGQPELFSQELRAGFRSLR